MRRIILGFGTLLCLGSCTWVEVYRPTCSSPPPIVVRADANEYGVHAGVSYDLRAFMACRSGPELEYQNQAGGWEKIYDRGWIDLPYNQCCLNFKVIPNGHFEAYEAAIDGVIIGSGASLNFGFGTGTKDGGKHLLTLTVSRSFSPELGDPVPQKVVDTRTYHIIVFYRASL